MARLFSAQIGSLSMWHKYVVSYSLCHVIICRYSSDSCNLRSQLFLPLMDNKLIHKYGLILFSAQVPVIRFRKNDG